jgi:hypothetical protein
MNPFAGVKAIDVDIYKDVYPPTKAVLDEKYGLKVMHVIGLEHVKLVALRDIAHREIQYTE